MATQFGIVNAATSFGIATNIEFDETGEVVTYEDAVGDTQGVKVMNRQQTFTGDYTYDSDSPPPNVDENVSITVDGTARIFKFTGVKFKEENKGFRTSSVTGQRWIANTVPSSV